MSGASFKLRTGQEIGSPHTFVIAEIGSNHGCDLSLALDTIDAAADAGADAAKFQSLRLDQQWYQPSADLIKLHQKIDLDESWYPALQERCEKRGLVFFSAPTYFGAVDLLQQLDVPLYKLASAQVGTFPQIVDRVAATGKPVILSTGIVTEPELDLVVQQLRLQNADNFAILHCNSIYPTPTELVHLPRMLEYARRYQCPVGFSDHTCGITIPVAAVAMGASIIEKHFLLDSKVDCPDASFSLDPAQFAEMTRQIRQVEQAIRPADREVLEPAEHQFKQHILQKLVLRRPKKRGERFLPDDFQYLRNEAGVDCREQRQVIDHYVAAAELRAGELLEWSQLGKAS